MLEYAGFVAIWALTRPETGFVILAALGVWLFLSGVALIARSRR
jgi:uncharacterized membrane protein